MQLAFSTIDAIQDGGDEKVDAQKSRALWFTGIGTGGPAITAGVMLLLNKIALALFTGLGPIFILCLLFEQTKQLFGKWLFYGIGTMFSLAVLSVMVGIALDVVTAVAASFWVGSFIGASNEGVNSMALLQGGLGLGLVLTMLIISAPPMAASFFQGMMGTFMAHSQFGGLAGTQAGARGAGSPPVYSQQPQNVGRPNDTVNQPPSQILQQYQSSGSQVMQSDAMRASDQAVRGNAIASQPPIARPPPPVGGVAP